MMISYVQFLFYTSTHHVLFDIYIFYMRISQELKEVAVYV